MVINSIDVPDTTGLSNLVLISLSVPVIYLDFQSSRLLIPERFRLPSPVSPFDLLCQYHINWAFQYSSLSICSLFIVRSLICQFRSKYLTLGFPTTLWWSMCCINFLQSSDAFNTSALPTIQSEHLARVKATFTRRWSLRKPIEPLLWPSLIERECERTQDKMMMSHSEPWKPSTVATLTLSLELFNTGILDTCSLRRFTWSL